MREAPHRAGPDMGYLIRMRRLLGDKERTKHECGYVVVGIGGGHSVMCSYERGAPLFHLLLSALTLPRPVRTSKTITAALGSAAASVPSDYSR